MEVKPLDAPNNGWCFIIINNNNKTFLLERYTENVVKPLYANPKILTVLISGSSVRADNIKKPLFSEISW